MECHCVVHLANAARINMGVQYNVVHHGMQNVPPLDIAALIWKLRAVTHVAHTAKSALVTNVVPKNTHAGVNAVDMVINALTVHVYIHRNDNYIFLL